MNCRSRFFSATGMVLLLAASTALAAEKQVNYQLAAENNSTNAINVGATGHVYAYYNSIFGRIVIVNDDIEANDGTNAHGVIDSNLSITFNPATHVATIDGIKFNYHDPGQILIDDAHTVVNINTLIGTMTENVDTSGVKGTLLTESGIYGTVSSSVFSFENHSVEVNEGTLNATGVYSYTSDFNQYPSREPGPAGSTGTVTVSGPSAPYNIGRVGSMGQVTYDYTTQLTVPFTATEPLNYSGSTSFMGLTVYYELTGEAVISGEIISNGSFSHTFDLLLGDTTLNGTVNIDDLGNLLANYGASSGMGWMQGDTTGEGAVNINDLGDLLANYGGTIGGVQSMTTTVPEPGALALLFALVASLAGFGWIKRRRAR